MVGIYIKYLRKITFVLSFILAVFPIVSQNNIVFVQNNNISSLPISAIDSILAQETGVFDIYIHGNLTPIRMDSDTAFYNVSLSDTLIIDYNESWVSTINPHLDWVSIEVNGTNVMIKSESKHPFICLLRGESSNGKLVVESDTTVTLVFDGLNISNQEGCAIYMKERQTTIIELKDGTTSIVEDAPTYQNTETNACIYSRGSLVFTGTGVLCVKGNYRHAISSNKNVTVNDGQIIIQNTQKDGIHCDKYRQYGGLLDLHLLNPATKGVKTKELIELTGGQITGEALGDLTIKDGETTYCTLLKSDSSFVIQGGSIDVTHFGNGGRCISVDADLLMRGGNIDLKCHGNGGGYLTALNDSDYYTAKCMTVNGNIFVQRGHIKLLSTGGGGKGMDCSDTIFVGINGDDFISEDSLLIEIETRGSAIVENVIEDYLHGSPKALKADNAIELYSGNIRIKTFGSGGEGIESKGSLRAYNATIIADCYDDGINTGQRCYIKGAHVYCKSINNDGIDSNGKFSVHDGIVAAISEHFMNESFDTEGGRLYVYGGHVIGIGNNEVFVSEQSSVPYYSTKTKINDWGIWYGDSIGLKANQYLTVSNVLSGKISVYHISSFEDAFITVASNILAKDELYQITDGDPPSNPSLICFDGQLLFGGIIDEREIIYNFNPY